MRRIDSPSRAVDLFGAGKDGFKASVPGVAPATELTDKWFNGVQESIVRTIEAAGLSLSEADFDQFVTAINTLDATARDEAIAAAAAYTTSQINALINAAPGALDTLKELADALGDDPNFATTMTNALAGKERKFDSGTRMLFQQTAAPVGWTKITTHNDKTLRVVSGSVVNGGTVAFSTAFVNGSVGNTALTLAQIPAHNHDNGAYTNLLKPPYVGSLTGTDTSGSGTEQAVGVGDSAAIASAGGGTAHTHTLNLDVSYVDVIIASKD